jgi:hypothetical protein
MAFELLKASVGYLPTAVSLNSPHDKYFEAVANTVCYDSATHKRSGEPLAQG